MSLFSCCLQETAETAAVEEKRFEERIERNQNAAMADEEECQKVQLEPDQFNGLIGSLAGNFIREKVGGPGGDILAGLAGKAFGGDSGGGGGGGGGFFGGGGGGGGGNYGGGGGGYNDYGGGGYSGGGGGGGGYNDGSGGGGGNAEPKRKRDQAMDLIGGLIGGVVNRKHQKDDGGGGRGGGGGGGGFGDMIGGFLGGGGNRGGGGGGGGGGYNDGGGRQGGGGGGFNFNDIGGIIKNISGGGGGGGGGGPNIGSLIGGLIGGGGGGGGRFQGGGGNVNPNNLNGGMVNIIGNLIGEAAHRFLGVDPATGRIIGAVAGNVIMGLGGKDNSLGSIGKVVLDNIISGKFRRDVDPYVRPEPRGGGGGGGPSPIQPVPTHAPVDFYDERDKCLAEKRLYEDPYFAADDRSLFFSKRPPKRIEWLRPGQIVQEPQLITEGHSRFDVIQGELGDCWLLAAAANLTLKDELFYRVCPPDQSFTENYAGIFHFQFWQYGKWVDVVIDDRLPCSDGKLMYMHSESNNEFWSALLEKAYAKLHGSYEALKGGTTSEALEDMTGGLTEFIDLKNPPQNLMQMMLRGFEMGSLFGCSIEADPRQWEARMPNGLVKGHAYSITGMRIVNNVCLLRIRNPWGNEQEWNGPWSDNSREWRSVGDDVKQDMGLKFDHDGEFWMSYEDYMRQFEKMEICNLGPDVMDEVYQMTGVRAGIQTWATNNHDGAWIRNQTAGGCRNYINTFPNNPQFRVQLTDSDPNDDDQLCTVIFAVMQKFRRNLKAEGLDNVPIGFAVYDAGGNSGRLSKSFFQNNKSAMRSAAFINLREMTGRFRVPPGNYVIVPSTFEPNEEAEFMLRVFTNGFIESEEL